MCGEQMHSVPSESVTQPLFCFSNWPTYHIPGTIVTSDPAGTAFSPSTNNPSPLRYARSCSGSADSLTARRNPWYSSRRPSFTARSVSSISRSTCWCATRDFSRMLCHVVSRRSKNFSSRDASFSGVRKPLRW